MILEALFLCTVVSVADGDTFTCADRTKVRVAGANAREMRGDPCPRARPCPPMSAAAAKHTLTRMTLGLTLHCRQVGESYTRIVADCTLPSKANLSCALIASGAAADWPAYRVRYRMRRCPNG